MEITRGGELNVDDVYSLGKLECRVILSEEIMQDIEESSKKVRQWCSEGRVIYGVTTGLGDLIHHLIPPKDSGELSRNIIHSHAAGVGPSFSNETVKRTMALRLCCFAKGYSGVTLELANLLREMINRNIIPIVPIKGSVGSSGDLAPLSHIALSLIGEGKVSYQGEIVSTAEAFKKEGLSAISFSPKEGLACMNGTSAMTAVGVEAIKEAEALLKNALIAVALSEEVLLASGECLTSEAINLRPHKGIIRVAEILRKLLAGSKLIRKEETIRVEFDKILNRDTVVHTDKFRQDCYSLRANPQIIGPILEAYKFSKGVVTTEINSVDDNPLVFCELDRCLHSAHFHGQPVSQAMDFLKIAICQLAVLSERRSARLLDRYVSKGLTPFLGATKLRCAFEGGQYMPGSLIAENRALSSPLSNQSVSLNAQFQDVVSMGLISARFCKEVIENTRRIIGFELLAAVQAADERGVDKLAPLTRAVYDRIRQDIPSLNEDRPMYEEFEKIDTLVKDEILINLLEHKFGKELLSLKLQDEIR